MKHPNKKYEAKRKAKCQSIIEGRRISCFNFWLSKENQDPLYIEHQEKLKEKNT